jgi:hypothetical protein
MKLLIDFHCHLYPIYDLRKALLFAQKSSLALILTERHDCSYFDSLMTGQIDLGKDLTVTKLDQNCCKITENFFVFRGRQYSTLEGIEVLSLLASPNLEEKLPARNYCEAIAAAGGLIAFSWAFGKWRGTRGSLISSLAQEYGPDRVVLLDSRLRTNFLALPNEFRTLETKGFRSFVGSDPLPLRWHEDALGSFGSLFNAEFENSSGFNSESLRKLIFSNQISQVTGRRSGLISFSKVQIGLRL